MGLFGNSQTKEFKNKMVDVFNLVSNFSYGDLPMSMASTAEATIESNYRQLKSLYNRFSNPFEESFNYYTSFGADRISIAEGMYIAYLAKVLVFRGQKMSSNVHQQITIEARALYSSSAGRQEMARTINNS